MSKPDLMKLYHAIKEEERIRRIQKRASSQTGSERLRKQREYIWQRRAVDRAPLAVIAEELGCSLENVKGIWRRLKRNTTIITNPKDQTNDHQ